MAAVGYESNTSWNTTVAGGAPVIIWGVNARNNAGDSGQLQDGSSLGDQVVEFDFSTNDATFLWDHGIVFPNGCYVSFGNPATVFYTLLQ